MRVRGVVSAPPFAGAVLLAAAVLLATAAPAASKALVRVLLYQGPGPAEVRSPASAKPTVVRARAGGLRVDGEAVARWRSAPGVSQYGDLRVRGRIEVVPVAGGLAVINELPLEEYVAGTVGREMHPTWASAALRAQAVVSRTYALRAVRRPQASRRAANPWHLRADTRSQVYGGVEAESPPVLEAVEQTAGQVLTFRGEPILAAFHSASGGRTASAEEVWGEPVPYLKSLEVDDEEDSPATYWRASITHTTLGRALVAAGHAIGTPRTARVVERSASGRVLRVELTGSRGAIALGGRELRGALGESTLKSTLFDIREKPEALVFVGSGHGHGVGMSQWGAHAMAAGGSSHAEILKTFYPGTRLEVVADLAGRAAFEGVRSGKSAGGAR